MFPHTCRSQQLQKTTYLPCQVTTPNYNTLKNHFKEIGLTNELNLGHWKNFIWSSACKIETVGVKSIFITFPEGNPPLGLICHVAELLTCSEAGTSGTAPLASSAPSPPSPASPSPSGSSQEDSWARHYYSASWYRYWLVRFPILE